MQLSVQHSVQYPIAPGKVTASSLGQPKKEQKIKKTKEDVTNSNKQPWYKRLKSSDYKNYNDQGQ
jgi:hypothetical protein